MKILVKTSKYKKYNNRHSKKQARAKQMFLLYRKRKNKYGIKVEHQTKSDILKTIKTKKFRDNYGIPVPKNFSLINNAEETISFINGLGQKCESNIPVFIDLENVEYIGNEIIVVLLAIMIKFKKKEIEFNGNFPKNPQMKNMILKSKFFDVLYNKSYVTSANMNTHDLSGNGIYTHSNTIVNSELGSQVIEQATKSIWKKAKTCNGVQGTIIELMTNTNNHAGETRGEKKWWLSINCNDNIGKVNFSFVDFGKGIFNSLSESKHIFAQWFEKISSNSNREDVLKQILTGEMHKTITGECFRGKGLPSIYENFRMKNLSKLFIISNDVYADIENNTYKKLSVNFTGTFVCWELSKENASYDIEE